MIGALLLWTLGCGEPPAPALPPPPAPAHLAEQAACERGEATSCGSLGQRYEYGQDVPVDTAKAWSLYQRTCELGAPRGCTAVANMLRKGTAPGGPDPARALVLLAESCKQGDGIGCASLAQHHENQGDLPAARAAAAAGCAAGELVACSYATALDRPDPAPPAEACAGPTTPACVTWFEHQIRQQATRAEAESALNARCEGADAQACVALGLFYSKGIGLAANPQRAAALYERACKTDPVGCFNLALLLNEGRGVPADRARGAALLASTCDRGYAAGCVMLGNTLADTGDPAGAAKRYEQACEAGEPIGCTNFALGLLDPVSGPPDPDRALHLLLSACERQDPFGCAVLGREMIGGRYRPADPVRGEHLLRGACAQGVGAACAALGSR